MNPGLAFALGGLIALVVSLLLLLWRLPHLRKESLEDYRAQLEREAKIGAQEKLYRERESFEAALEVTREELKELEDRCRIREDGVDRRVEGLESRERQLASDEAKLKAEQAALEARQAEVERSIQKNLRELERISGMRREEAENHLLERVEERCRKEAEVLLADAEVSLQAELKRRATETLITAMQRLALSHAHQALITVVPLSEEIKPLLIGREGRNARTFEAQTGVDLLIDDTPGVVLLSCFEPVRREIARWALLRLLKEGRIHPGRIEEVVSEARQEMEEAVSELGGEAAKETKVDGLHARLLALLGRLEFRFSEGQNGRLHAVETAQLAGTLAGELGLEPAIARRCGLLHSVGKAVEQDAEGSFATVGADFARRCGEDSLVVNAIAAQRGEVAAESPYADLVHLASTVTLNRPGAGNKDFEGALRRQEELEAVAAKHPGVKRSWAIQAGRELRVIVDPSRVSDKGAQRLAREIAAELQKSHSAPGEVKVTVIRETRQEETVG